jgi:hypothetical protein
MRKLSYNYDCHYGGSGDDGDANNKNKSRLCVHSTPMISKENNTAAALDVN